jgi:uncharacterized membrane protein (UPF0127 family)
MRVVLATIAFALIGCAGDDDAVTATPTTALTTAPTTAPTSTGPTAAPTAATASPPTVLTNTSGPLSTVTSTAPPSAVVPEGFEQVAATVTATDGTVCELCLWLAATDDRRALGLMYVTDLGGPDGMIFHYDSPTTAAFWMKNTLMPLSIAFFGEDGVYLHAFDMAPCTADPCPSYPTPANFIDAIEVPQGTLDELSIAPGSVLSVSDLPCDPVN